MSLPRQTARLQFRPLTDDDVDVLVELTTDPEVMRYITGGRPIPRDEMTQVVVATRDHRWLAFTDEDDRCIGWFSLRPDRDRPGERELGYRLRRDAWGHGLATEGSRYFVAAAFNELGCQRVWAQTMTVNERSRRVLEKCGLRYSHTFHPEWDEPIEGTAEGDVVYAITREQWDSGDDAGGPTIRPAVDRDAPDLQDIEVAAGERFRSIGMDDIADHDPLTLDQLHEYAKAGRSWVVLDDDGRVAGYVVVDDVDGNAHVEQVSVRPDQQGRGRCRALLDHVSQWAAANDRPALTLTTFTDVPWNRPLYEHLGFRVLEDGELGPELRARYAHEAVYGLDPAIRACMRREVEVSRGARAAGG